MTDVRHILVLPDREAAEEIAEEIARDLAERSGDGNEGGNANGEGGEDGTAGGLGGGFGAAPDDRFDEDPRDALADGLDDDSGEEAEYPRELQLVREALAGEDDAEDAQWLVVLQGPRERYDPDRLEALANEYDGWLERS